MRRSHSRANEGARGGMETGADTSGTDGARETGSPTLAGSLGKGSLGSEIIARVVDTAVSWAVDKAVG